MFDEEQAQFVCDFLECLTCSSGVPLRLMDWQRNMITEFYGQLIEDEDDRQAATCGDTSISIWRSPRRTASRKSLPVWVCITCLPTARSTARCMS